MRSNFVGVRRFRGRGSWLLAVLGSLVGTTLLATTASAVVTGVTFKTVAAGSTTGCALSTDASPQLYCWGSNVYQQMQDGATTSALTPELVDISSTLGSATIEQFVSGAGTVCVLASSDVIYCWGYGGQGQIGNNSFANATSPQAVQFPVGRTGSVKELTGTGNTSFCALMTTSQIWCWGGGVYGSLGNGTNNNADAPVKVDRSGVLAGLNITAIAGSGQTFCALDDNGKAYCWGDGLLGALGNGSTALATTPVAVTASGALSGKKLTAIAPASDHTCAVDTLGEVFCWGSNDYGTLGLGLPDGKTTPSSLRTTPQLVSALSAHTVTSITSSGTNSCALTTSGSLYCWGGEPTGDGNLGGNALSPVAITGGTSATATLTHVSSADYGACAVDSYGSLYCWGVNDNAQIGDGTKASSAYSELIAVAPGAPSTPTLPGSPSGPTLAAGPKSVQVTWSVPINDGNSPILSYTATASDGTNNYTCTANGASATTCTINALTNGTSYSVTLFAHNAIGDSSIVHVGSAVPADVPDAPTLVSAKGGASSFVVTWSAGADEGSPITGYRASATYLSTVTSCSASSASATSCSIAGLSDGVTYDVSVVAINHQGNSVSSNVLHATALDAPGAPASVTATPQNQAVAVSWTAPSATGGSPITGYAVTASPGTASCSTTTTLSCTLTGLTPTTGYTLSVRATNAQGPGPARSSIVVYPYAPSSLAMETATPVLSKGVAFKVIVAGSAPHSNVIVTLNNVAAQSCVLDAVRQCTVTMSEPLNGDMRLVAKVGGLPATLYVWVPLVSTPAIVHHGHNVGIRITDCPALASVSLHLSDGRVLNAKATLKGIVSLIVAMPKKSVVTITTTIAGTVISPTNKITVL